MRWGWGPRSGRPKIEIFTPENDPTFQIGKLQTLNAGSDVSIFACGHLVWEALKACQILETRGISAEILNLHTIKPLDEAGIVASVHKTRCVVSAEEHNVLGGMGDAIAHVLARHLPVPQEYVGTQDTFGESGTPEQLMEKYGLTAQAIVLGIFQKYI